MGCHGYTHSSSQIISTMVHSARDWLRLAKRPQRRDPVRRRRTSDQDDLPPPARPRGCLADQPGLANTRLACDDDAGTATASRPAEDLRECGQFHIRPTKTGHRMPGIVACPLLRRHTRPVAFSKCINRRARPTVPSARRRSVLAWHRGPSDMADRGAQIQSFCAGRPQGTRHRQAVRNRQGGWV